MNSKSNLPKGGREREEDLLKALLRVNFIFLGIFLVHFMETFRFVDIRFMMLTTLTFFFIKYTQKHINPIV